uniref:Uncharacterized protein n=1 Tax=Glossina austeni TaxID=7395 RepID=A0A1A9UL99_GLOAU
MYALGFLVESANSEYSLNQYVSNVKLLGTFKDGYEPSYRNSLNVRSLRLSHDNEQRTAMKMKDINIANCSLRLSASTTTIGGMTSLHMYHVRAMEMEDINIANCSLRLSASTSAIGGGMTSLHMYHVRAMEMKDINIANCSLRLSASASAIGGMTSLHMYHVRAMEMKEHNKSLQSKLDESPSISLNLQNYDHLSRYLVASILTNGKLDETDPLESYNTFQISRGLDNISKDYRKTTR